MKRLCILLLFALLFAHCSHPSVLQRFVRVEGAADGLYSFTMDFSDSTCTYDISIYTRVESPDRNSRYEIPLSIIWISPSGNRYTESVYLHSYSSRGVVSPYRKDIVPVEYGKWVLGIKPEYVPDGFCGVGIFCEKKAYGTR